MQLGQLKEGEGREGQGEKRERERLALAISQGRGPGLAARTRTDTAPPPAPAPPRCPGPATVGWGLCPPPLSAARAGGVQEQKQREVGGGSRCRWHRREERSHRARSVLGSAVPARLPQSPPSPQPGASDPPRCPTGARSRDQPLRDEDGCQRMEVSDSAGRCRDGPSAPDRPRQAGPGPTPSPTATCARSLGQLSPAPGEPP